MSSIAILWLLFSADGPAVVRDLAASKAAPAPAIEIVLTGPRESCSKMETAIRAVVGSDVDLGWSRLDPPPEDRLPTPNIPNGGSGEASGLRTNHVWLDLRNPAKLSIYLPVGAPQETPLVRTVWRLDGDAEDGDRVAREEVAQIVKTAVLALQGRATPEVPAPDPIASDGPETSPLNPPVAAVAVADRRGPVERSFPVSVFLGAGTHTSPWNLSNGIGHDHGLGPSFLGAGRWHARNLELGLRLGWERSEVDGYRYNVKSDYFLSTLMGAYRFPGQWLSLSFGLQAGVLALHQNTSQTMGTGYPLARTAGKTWAAGPIAGLVLEMDLAISRRIFLHLDAAAPIGAMRIDDGQTTRWYWSGYVQTTLGLGFNL